MAKHSLGGAERRVATAGVGSSPTASTKRKLREQLRKLDRQIGERKRCTLVLPWWRHNMTETLKTEALDRKRKAIREQLKGRA